MSIYYKYVLHTIVPSLLILLLLISSLVWVTQGLGFLYLIENGIGLWRFISMMSMLLPYMLFMVLPITTFLATMHVYRFMKQNRQLLVLQASGMSHYAIMKPTIILSLIVTIFSYYLSAVLIPISYSNLKNNLNLFRENYISNVIEPGTFNQISKYATLYVDKKYPDYQISGVVLFDNHDSNSQVIFCAKYGQITTGPEANFHFKLDLKDGVRYSYDKNGRLVTLGFDNISVDVAPLKQGYGRSRGGLEMSINELLHPEENLSNSRKTKFIADGYTRLLWPLFNIILPFLGGVIFLLYPTSREQPIWEYAWSCGSVLVMLYIYFVLQKLSYKDLFYIKLIYCNMAFFTLLPIYLIFLHKKGILQ